jgi:hypothetical protein
MIPISRRREEGLQILNALLDHTKRFRFIDGDYDDAETQVKIYKGLHYIRKAYPPKIGRVVKDISELRHGDTPDMAELSSGIRGDPVQDSGLDILTAMMVQMGTNQDMAIQVPLSIPATREGLGKCGLTLPPWIKGRSTTTEWKTSLALPGTVTKMHTDYWLTGQVMQHIHGKKLWLIWPQTVTNVEHNVWSFNTSPSINNTLEAIEKIPGLLVFFLQERTTFYLPPLCRHAVLTFDLSTHTGTQLCNSMCENPLRLLEGSIKRRLINEGLDAEDEQEIIKTLFFEVLHDVELWRRWSELNTGEEYILDFLATLTEDICKIADNRSHGM